MLLAELAQRPGKLCRCFVAGAGRVGFQPCAGGGRGRVGLDVRIDQLQCLAPVAAPVVNELIEQHAAEPGLELTNAAQLVTPAIQLHQRVLNEVFRVVDIAVKATEAKPGAQVVEREFGMFEVHSHSQATVLEAGSVVLDRLGLTIEDRVKPEIASMQMITNVDPYQAQLLNRFRRGSMLVAGETLLVLEVAPAAYINLAANEAEKAAEINILEVRAHGSMGRIYLGGEERDIDVGWRAAEAAIEALEGRVEE